MTGHILVLGERMDQLAVGIIKLGEVWTLNMRFTWDQRMLFVTI